MKVLFLLVNALDRPEIDEDFVWERFCRGLRALPEDSCVTRRLPAPTQLALKDMLRTEAWDVLHLVTESQQREASYSTITLLSADKRSRLIPTRQFAELITDHPGIRLVVLQTRTSLESSNLARHLVEDGINAVVVAPDLRGHSEDDFLRTLYEGLHAGASLQQLQQSFAALDQSGIWIAGHDMTQPVLPASHSETPPELEPTSTPSPVKVVRVDDSKPIPAATDPDFPAERIRRKRASGQYDVFLCHNSDDKPLVKQLALSLIQAGILPWLDEWELPPGKEWQSRIEKQIASIRSAVVCLGPDPVTGWHRHEMQSLLIEFTESDRPVIPVILPNVVGAVVQVPAFLRGRTWVDLRRTDPDPIQQLIWGITETRPPST